MPRFPEPMVQLPAATTSWRYPIYPAELGDWLCPFSQAHAAPPASGSHATPMHADIHTLS